MSLKINIICRRRPGMTSADSHHHFRNVHGELVLDYIKTDPEHAPLRYVQDYVTDSIFRSSVPGEDPLAWDQDIVSQLWFDDFEALQACQSTAFYTENVKEDEGNFADMKTALFLPTQERPVFDDPASSSSHWKALVGLKRAEGATAEDFDAGWRKAVEQRPDGAVRHVQNIVTAPPGMPMPLDGLDEFWAATEDEAYTILAGWIRTVEQAMAADGLIEADEIVGYLAREDVLFAG